MATGTARLPLATSDVEPAAAPLRRGFRGHLLMSGPILALAGVLLIWHVLSIVFPRTLFPGIVETFQKIPELYAEPTFWRDVAHTSARTLVGFLLATLAGAVAGISMGYSGLTQTLVRPLIVVIQTISAVIWCFFSVIWFGLTDLSVTFVVFIAGFPIMAFSLWEGVKNIDLDTEAMARAFRVSRWRTVRYVTIPSIYPYLFVGIRSSFSYCWRTAILAELVIGKHGLGYSMYYAWQNFRVTEVFAWVVITIGLMLASEYALIRPFEAYLLGWRPKRDPR
jgi:NitT/TauT family transport system permease protein